MTIKKRILALFVVVSSSASFAMGARHPDAYVGRYEGVDLERNAPCFVKVEKIETSSKDESPYSFTIERPAAKRTDTPDEAYIGKAFEKALRSLGSRKRVRVAWTPYLQKVSATFEFDRKERELRDIEYSERTLVWTLYLHCGELRRVDH